MLVARLKPMGRVLQKKIEGSGLRRDHYGEPYYYRLVTNAYSMLGDWIRGASVICACCAYLPLARRPESENALLLCYGVGVNRRRLYLAIRVSSISISSILRRKFSISLVHSGIEYSNPVRDSRVEDFVQDGRFSPGQSGSLGEHR